jgi:hypothetical protein
MRECGGGFMRHHTPHLLKQILRTNHSRLQMANETQHLYLNLSAEEIGDMRVLCDICNLYSTNHLGSFTCLSFWKLLLFYRYMKCLRSRR